MIKNLYTFRYFSRTRTPILEKIFTRYVPVHAKKSYVTFPYP